MQDAGLIFLSAMSHKIATSILEEGGDEDNEDLVAEVLSSTIVLLGLSTASLGVVLIIMGKFRLADVVAYLPLPGKHNQLACITTFAFASFYQYFKNLETNHMHIMCIIPYTAVVGGYLAFIGYFCVEAGVSLCISKPIMQPSDWSNLLNKQSFMLAVPGVIAGVVLTGVARKCENEAMLPISMVIIPVAFYIVLFGFGLSIEDAREGGWVGETSPPVPVGDLFHLIDFGKVRWDLAKDLIPTWAGE